MAAQQSGAASQGQAPIKETDQSGAIPRGTAPINETYYHCSGPATAFEKMFDPRVCSYGHLFKHLQPTIEQAKKPHGDGEQAANLIHEAIHTVVAKPDCKGVEHIVLTTIDADGQGTGGLLQCSGCTGVAPGGTLRQDIVTDMIHAGALHFKQNLDRQHGNVYEALRVYNSGSIASDGDLASPKSVGTPSYVTDIANWLHGWIDGRNA
ncbi:hypothetical protein EDD37DRAFT_608298 [Exophiala viscosa]|uniref:uncharacterized protein n=1 Tax=Exophiala viscosa TaxID=2486360 RepID=UPI00218DE113|nr:hypothetical protein EDD37DRAFT_608298 [Exophiala viscosa]